MLNPIDLHAGLMGLNAFFMLGSAWRLWVTLFVLHPVVAQLAGTDYREAERNFDRELRKLGVGGRLDASEPLADDDPRLTESYWHFTDASGVRQDITISEYAKRGTVPEPARVLWVDPDNPTRPTRYGPGFWCLCTILAATALGWLAWTGPNAFSILTGTPAP